MPPNLVADQAKSWKAPFASSMLYAVDQSELLESDQVLEFQRPAVKSKIGTIAHILSMLSLSC